jgi:hypothetical protein
VGVQAQTCVGDRIGAVSVRQSSADAVGHLGAEVEPVLETAAVEEKRNSRDDQ